MAEKKENPLINTVKEGGKTADAAVDTVGKTASNAFTETGKTVGSAERAATSAPRQAEWPRRPRRTPQRFLTT